MSESDSALDQQRHAGRETLQVPGEMTQVRLVEVVHIEDQHAQVVEVGAEVLRVQITLDPHPASALVSPRIRQLADIGVEQAGAAAVEGERVGGHLANLVRKATGSEAIRSAKAPVSVSTMRCLRVSASPISKDSVHDVPVGVIA